MSFFTTRSPSDRSRRGQGRWARPYEDEVVWGAHGQASGRGPVPAYPRPGFRRPLEGPYPLGRPLSLGEVRERHEDVTRIEAELKALIGERAPYFPVVFRSDGVRFQQSYLTKMPLSFVRAFAQLQEVEALAARTRPTASRPSPARGASELGADYNEADEAARTAERDPYAVDPNLVDRALRSHARVQNELARAVLAMGATPRRSAPGEPPFDLAWEHNEFICVAEVKSLRRTNEEKQLRLALGQVLRYGQLLEAKGKPVRRFIVIERPPSDDTWRHLCGDLGVTLTWPGDFGNSVPTD